MTLSEKNCLLALAEISLIRSSSNLEITEDLFFLASAHSKNQLDFVKSILTQFKNVYKIVDKWNWENGKIHILLSPNFPFPLPGSIDLNLLRIKHTKRILLYKLYVQYLETGERYARYPLVKLSEIIEVEKDQIFNMVLLLEEEFKLKYGLADGGNCTSYLTNEGIKLCEDKAFLFEEFCQMNLDIKEEQVDESNSKNLEYFDSSYVSKRIIEEITSLKSTDYDLSKLIKFLTELNDASEKGNVFSIAMLLRAIIDHIPPVFNKKNFTEVLNNYSWAKSNRVLIERLDISLRNIADSYLHTKIKEKETIPSLKQVDFRAELDILLCEIISILK